MKNVYVYEASSSYSNQKDQELALFICRGKSHQIKGAVIPEDQPASKGDSQ